MTRALVWKEVREQGTVLVALVVLGAAVLVSAAVLLDPGESGRATELRSIIAAGRLGLLLLTVTAGMVVGGTLFAGEREAGTFAFLDRLPGSRWRVWWRKVLTGAALVAVAVAVFLAVAAGGGLFDRRTGLVGWVMLIGVVAFASYGWGVLGSVMTRTSLAACGVGLGLGVLTGCVLYVVLGVALTVVRRELGLWRYFGSEFSTWETAYLVASYALLALPLPIAAWLFTGPDRARRLAEINVRLPGVKGVMAAGVRGVSGVRFGAGSRRLVWLTVRQLRGTALALTAAALVVGCILLPEEAVAVAVWPVLGLVAGVLIGVVTLSDEQAGGGYRFWGERRLPAGRLWTAKVATGLGLTLLVTVALLVPAVVAALVGDDRGPRRPFVAEALRSGILAEPEFPVLTFLLTWPVYGFAFGHLAGLLFRKAVVAAAVGILLGGTFAALWLPSLLAGGVHGWQVFAAPAVALLTARLLAWPWATDRLGTRRPLARLAAGAAGVLAVTAAGIGYRVIEVREVPDVGEDLAFAATLPSFDDKQSGRDLRRTVAQLSETTAALRFATVEEPAGAEPGQHRDRSYLGLLSEVFESGWPADRPDLDIWLTAMFESRWDEGLPAFAAKPTGVLEDPAELAPDSPLRNIDGIRPMVPLLLARGLKLQAGGDPKAFADSLPVILAVIRTVRRDTLALPTLISRGQELQVYAALDRWTERLDGRPDLLRAALAAVQDHDRRDPYDPQAVQFAHQVVARNAVLAPSRWMPHYFDEMRVGFRERGGSATPASETETDLVGFAWTVPWEKERLRRAVGLGNRPGRRLEQNAALRGAPGWRYLMADDIAFRSEVEGGRKLLLAARRAAILKLAARLHEVETGALPARLDALVPKYLPAVPADPFDDKPFRYRVSAGERIMQNRPAAIRPDPPLPPGIGRIESKEFHGVAGVAGGVACWPLEPGWDEFPFAPQWSGAGATTAPRLADDLAVAPGRGILWSVGPDEMDNAATAAIDPGMAGQRPAGDLVYLIPRPAKPEENR